MNDMTNNDIQLAIHDLSDLLMHVQVMAPEATRLHDALFDQLELMFGVQKFKLTRSAPLSVIEGGKGDDDSG